MRPGVPTTMCGGWVSESSCGPMGTPPHSVRILIFEIWRGQGDAALFRLDLLTHELDRGPVPESDTVTLQGGRAVRCQRPRFYHCRSWLWPAHPDLAGSVARLWPGWGSWWCSPDRPDCSVARQGSAKLEKSVFTQKTRIGRRRAVGTRMNRTGMGLMIAELTGSCR